MPASATVRVRDLLAVRPYSWLLAAAIQSQVGNQLARVALAVLVYDRTGSPAATSIVFAMTILPAVVGGLTLGHLADRLSRRDVMAVCDVVRLVAFTVMGAVDLPIGWLYAVLAVAVFLSAPFGPAQAAVVPRLVGEDRYVAASGLLRSCDQAAALVGYGVGGALVAALGTGSALVIDAATFALSVLIVRFTLPRDSAAARSRAAARSTAQASMRSVARLVLADRRLRLLVPVACLVGWYVVPEGLAAPYAAQLGGGALAVGALLACFTAGAAVGGLLVVPRMPQKSRERFMGPLAVAAGAPLAVCWAGPPLAASMLLWFVSGVACCFVLIATATYSLGVPDAVRGTAIGLAGSLLLAAQGVAALIGGALADLWSASAAIGICAVAGMLSAALLALRWQSVRRVRTIDGSDAAAVQPTLGPVLNGRLPVPSPVERRA